MTQERAAIPVLVANGPWRWTRDLAALAGSAEPVLAADGGANHLAAIGLRPKHVIGDLDSISAATRAWVGEERLVHRPDQNHTDLEKAVSFAFDELRLDTLLVLAALGGRLDHVVSNLGLLARLGLGSRLIFRAPHEQILAVTGRLEMPAVAGETWSFWTFDPQVRVSVSGVRWPVNDLPLDPTVGSSVSNCAVSDTIVVETTGGAVLVLRQRTADGISTLG